MNSYIIALVVASLGTITCTSASNETQKVVLTVSEFVYDNLKRDYEILHYENDKLLKRIEKLNQGNEQLICIQRQFEDLQRTCEGSNQERRTLKNALTTTEEYLYQLEWKVIVQQSIYHYEREFDNYEIRQVSTFQLNRTLLNGVDYDDDYDRLAEQRRQRWLFYLNNPLGAFWNFNDMVNRVEKSNHTKEEFAKGLAILYNRLMHVIYQEAMETKPSVVRPLTKCEDVNFVIPILVAQCKKTKPITRMLNELKSCLNDPDSEPNVTNSTIRCGGCTNTT